MKRLILIATLYLLSYEFVFAVNFIEAKRLAEQGDAWYQTEIALKYHEGRGVPRDLAEALKWYRKAADQGFAKAQTNIGVMYGEGQGLPQDYTKASEWFQMAAEQGNAQAQHNLGLLYGRGQGVPQDYAEAYIWESLAADSGLEDAIINRDICAAELSSEELQSAKRRELQLYLRIQHRRVSK